MTNLTKSSFFKNRLWSINCTLAIHMWTKWWHFPLSLIIYHTYIYIYIYIYPGPGYLHLEEIPRASMYIYIYKLCSTICLHFYGLHRSRVLKISGDQTLALEKIHQCYFFSFEQIQRKILISFWKMLTKFSPTLGLPTKSWEKKLISWI